MKIAVTADVHLTTREDNPERFHALEDIFASLAHLEIAHLIIAGDLFDKDISNYSEFEALCKKNENVAVHLIPGNHDPSVKNEGFSDSNVTVYSEPKLDEDNLGCPFLFVPYKNDLTMAKAIATQSGKLDPYKWILVGHGDHLGGIRQTSPKEKGRTYMPLYRSEIEQFKPLKVFLGHIHKSQDLERVHYPGSPCGLDITEVGKRKFLIYDTENSEISECPIKTDILFFDDIFTIYPADDEISRLEEKIDDLIKSWELDESELGCVTLRVKARGFCNDKQAIDRLLKEKFGDFTFYEDADPDVSELSVNNNKDLGIIAVAVKKKIPNMDWGSSRNEEDPDDDEIMYEAIKVIYD